MAAAAVRAAALVFICLLLASCGVRHDDVADPRTAPQAAAGKAQAPATTLTEREAANAVQVKPRKTPEKLPPPPTAAPTRQAEAQDVELPLYPGAQVQRSEATRAQRQSALVYLSTADSVETVYGWYKKQLAGAKLRDDQLVNNPQSPSATLTQELPDGLRQVSITRQGQQTMVLLTRLRMAGVIKR
ncbi:MAG: hypothetical protein HZB16_16305 [Armatimonadetes bacterium]|nr:hypothetical protein [Armatimonadota bacterium]